MKNEAVALLIPARLGSTRLPRKHLLPVFGRPILSIVLERCRASPLGDRACLCTTRLPEDDALADLAKQAGIRCFRGDPEDVLVRYRDACREQELTFFINVDGDDVLCSLEWAQVILEEHRNDPSDLVVVQGLAFGAAPIGVSATALERVCAHKTVHQTQNWVRFFHEANARIRTLQAPPALARTDIRMTLDYYEDYVFFKGVLEHIGYPQCLTIPLAGVYDVLARHPELSRVNRARVEAPARNREVDLGPGRDPP